MYYVCGETSVREQSARRSRVSGLFLFAIAVNEHWEDWDAYCTGSSSTLSLDDRADGMLIRVINIF